MPESLRIALIVGRFPVLSQTFVLDQLAGLLANGHQVTVFGRPPRGVDLNYLAPVDAELIGRVRYWERGMATPADVLVRSSRLLRSRPRGTFVAMARCLNVVRYGPEAASGWLWARASSVMSEPRRFDVVLAHFGVNGRSAHWLREVGAFDAPLVTIFHGYDLSRQVHLHGPALYRDLLIHGELMLPVNEHFRRRLITLGCPPERVAVQHMGVDLTRFRFEARRVALGEPVRFVSVGRLVEKKGFEFGLRGFARAVQRLGANVRWDIVGEGPLRARLQHLAEVLGVADRVHFCGAKTRADVLRLLRVAHIFFAPSVTGSDGDEEGIPVAIMEAQATGMPVLSTRHSGIPELVLDGQSGYLVDEWDERALAARIVGLAAVPASWPALGSAGRARVCEAFDEQSLNATLSRRLVELVRARACQFTHVHTPRSAGTPACATG